MQRALVESARRGDEASFTELARDAADRLIAIAFRILRDVDTAEDAVQQALVAAWRELPSLRDPDRFDAWLSRLVVHACYAEHRRAKRRAAILAVVSDEPAVTADASAAVADRDQLERGFRRLSIEHRAVFVLHHHEGMTLAEVGQALGIPTGTAKSRLHYATNALRAAIEADARPTIEERLA
jgi:RNA polymerase sigma-70 factor (ECF subfamily)